MNIVLLILIAVGLSFDTFAASISCGCLECNIKFRKAVGIALLFAFFQSFMPLLGWMLGKSFFRYIEPFDHWAAFALLSFIGIKMIVESFKNDDNHLPKAISFSVVLGLSFATTIDAFIVGIVFVSLNAQLVVALPIIGIVTFIAAMLGLYFGKKAGTIFGKKIEMAGGLILTVIGIKILYEHLTL